jgi:adenylate cyclase
LQNPNAGLIKVRFSIGAKLIILISIIVVVSLGSITALVSWLVHGDLQISAEENNFETNRRAAMEAEMTLENARSHSRILINTIMAAESDISGAIDFFFTENPQIASVFFITAGRQEQILANRRFFTSHEIEITLLDSWFESHKSVLERAVRGETVLLNAAPYFARPLLVLFFPWHNGGAGGVLFSSGNINQNFGFGTNQSYMINSDGDILSHTDFSLVRSSVNLSGEDFIRSILDSPQRNMQKLVESDFKLLQTADSLAGTPDNSSDTQAVIRKFTAFTRLNTAGAVVITSIEYDKVFEGIAATTRRNIYLTIAVLSISIIFVWFFSKTISIPIKALAVVAHNIEDGVFEMDLKPKGRDETGVLTASFQKMCAALRVFSKFTNREIALKSVRGEIKPGGLLKHATIFFSDIRDFTAKSEHFTKIFGDEASNSIIHWLNNYFTHMVDCVEKTNGVVDKFIGDAVMAHWGTATTMGSPEMDAYNCVKAALMMRNALHIMNSERDPDDPANPLIKIGCGINSGIVTAGQLGSDLRMEYTVIGDPVNLASRIEALTKSLNADILISENTWRLTGDKFITEEMPAVTVKGKKKPVRVFAVVNFAGNSEGPQTMADVRKLLGIEAPEISKAEVNARKKKINKD